MGVGGQRHAPAALHPGNRPDAHCIGGYVSPRTGLDGFGKSRPHLDSLPGPSCLWRVAIPTALYRPFITSFFQLLNHMFVYIDVY